MEQANEKIAQLVNEVNQLKENQQKIIKYVIQLRDDRDKIVKSHNYGQGVIESHEDRYMDLGGNIIINDFMKDDELFQEEEEK